MISPFSLRVSIAQIYRVFASKDDIVIAIVEQRMRAMGMEMHAIFDAVKRGELSTFEAMKAMVASLLADREVGLVFEILAEAGRPLPPHEFAQEIGGTTTSAPPPKGDHSLAHYRVLL